MVFERIFVTVGTTKFDELIQSLNNQEAYENLIQFGCQKLTLQIGMTDFVPSFLLEKQDEGEILIDIYSLKPSIKEDMEDATFVISHGGAGSILEALGMEKPTIVVVNDRLMDNHQMELASSLASNNHVFTSTPSNLLEAMTSLSVDQLVPFPNPDITFFPSIIDEIINFEN